VPLSPRPRHQDQLSHLASAVAVVFWTISFALIFFMQAGFFLLEGDRSAPRTWRTWARR